MLPDLPRLDGVQEFVRALRFPTLTLTEAAWFVGGAVVFALFLWASLRVQHRLDEVRRRRVPLTRLGQHRGALRVPFGGDAVLHPEGRDPVPGILCDLSAGGFSVLAETDLPPGTRVEIAFQAAGTGVRVKAEILRAERAHWSQRHYLHAKFLDMGPEPHKAILHAVTLEERRLRSGRD